MASTPFLKASAFNLERDCLLCRKVCLEEKEEPTFAISEHVDGRSFNSMQRHGLASQFRYNSDTILHLTNSDPIRIFCQIQHLKYIAYVTRLPNYSLQKQVFFRTNKKRYARDPWLRYEEITNLSKHQLQRIMQEKQRFLALFDRILGSQSAEPVTRERR